MNKLSKIKTKEELDDVISAAHFEDAKTRWEFISEIEKEIELAKQRVESSYLALIDCKSIFTAFKKENIQELKQYRREIEAECEVIKKQSEDIKRTLQDGLLKQVTSVLSELLKLKPLLHD